MTAAVLAEAGFEVLILEEGPDIDTTTVASNSTEAISRLYRNGGLTPILGSQSIAFVEGCCVGGSCRPATSTVVELGVRRCFS